MVILLLVSLWSLNFYRTLEREEMESRIELQLTNNFDQQIEASIKKLTSFLDFISQNTALQKKWSDRNISELQTLSYPIFSDLRYQHNITHFYFHDLTGTNYLRVHSPTRHGDKIERKTLQQSIKTGDNAAGLEFGALGQFVLRVVVPWEIDGKVVGYIELGKEIDGIIDRLSNNNGYPLILAVHKNFILKNNLQETDFFIKFTKQLEQADSIFVINKTINNLSPRLLTLIDRANFRESQSYSEEGRDYLVAKIGIRNFQQREIASLFYLVDRSVHVHHQQDLAKQISGIGFSVSILLSLFYAIYSRRLERSLRSNYDELNTEITQRKAIEKSLTKNQEDLKDLIDQRNISLEQSNKRYQTLFDKTADALLIIEGHQFVDCNRAALDMLKFNSKKELYDTHPSELSPEVQPDGQLSSFKADLMIETAFSKGSHRFEWDHRKKDGEIFPVEVLLTAIPFEDSQLLHVVWRDITARKRAAAAIEHQAYYDSLTGLPNRKLLLDRLGQAHITSRRHNTFSSLFFIDLDRFKSINDSLGHTVGDKLLVESANRIQSSVWDEDTVARFGGDEYVVLLKNLSDDKAVASLRAKKIATRIQDAFQAAISVDNQELHVTISIGITMFPTREESIEDIVKQADTAMYSAKDNGRNQIAFYLSEMHEKVIKRLGLEKDLRAAIKQDQLEVYYQPQLDSANQIIAVEALIRWKHLEQGFISPEEFIAIAEDTGLIYDIGDFVLNKAVADIQSVNKQFNLKLRLSVNISPHQFIKEDFVAKIKMIMENYQLDKNFLTLEVTEGIAIENLNDTIEKFEHLKHVGVKLSLDDFGTGYSSLSHLKRLPINELKIDKSFVFDIEDDPQDALLVQTIINIGHRFGLAVVAEGVETEQQLDFLKKNGCNIFQGYHHSRPLPLEALREYIESQLERT
jgi:diguanylate cyclase (GGDEF)-like protein/PAS domain S-box-containing protein